MMKTFLPHPLLREYIKSYNLIHLPASGISQEMKFLPTGNPCLVINLGSSYFVKNELYHEVIKEAEGVIIGQQNRYYVLKPENDFLIFLIIFQPTGIYRLLNFPVHTIGNKSARLCELQDEGLTGWFRSFPENGGDTDKMVQVTDNFFLQRLTTVHKNHPFIENAVQHIYRNNGFLSIRELACESNTSERNFRRRFYETVGIPPKKFILINRLHYILRMMQQKTTNMSWADIAYSCGYYDQMHFIKEFKKFSGETPTQYYSEHQQMQELYAFLFDKQLG